MGNNVLPARLRRVSACTLRSCQNGRRRGRTTALASVAAERILDGTILAAFGLVSISLVSVDRRLEWAVFVVSFAFTGLGSALMLGIRFHDRIRSFTAAANRKFTGHMTAFAREREKVTQFLDGFLPLGTLPPSVQRDRAHDPKANRAVAASMLTDVYYMLRFKDVLPAQSCP